MNKIQEITLPIIKISTNKIYAGRHWAKRKKDKDDYHLLMHKPFKDLEPVKNLCDLTFIFTFKRNCLDSSNCSYMGKLIEDCLAEYQILKDDSRRYVQFVTYGSEKGNEDSCLLSIEEIVK